MFNTIASWEFNVGVETDTGEVVTRWTVWSDEHAQCSVHAECAGSEEERDLFTQSEYGEAQGPLHVGIFAAYDALKLTCPLVLDPDLLRWGGHEVEEEAT